MTTVSRRTITSNSSGALTQSCSELKRLHRTENYAATTEIVVNARAALDAIAHDLIEHETISGDHVLQVIAAMVKAA